MIQIHQETESELSIQMAPMINVMLVVLAAFVATTGIVQTQYGMPIPTPQPGSGLPITEPVVLVISPAGDITVNQALLSGDLQTQVNALQQRLLRITSLIPDQPVVIRPHGNTSHERVVQVVEACKSADVKKLAFGESR